MKQAVDLLHQLSEDAAVRRRAREREDGLLLDAVGHREELAEARSEGKAGALLKVFEHRGLTVPPAVRERVFACADLGTLDRWLGRAFTCAHAEDLFVD